jgi:hypothetical protein
MLKFKITVFRVMRPCNMRGGYRETNEEMLPPSVDSHFRPKMLHSFHNHVSEPMVS